MVIEAVLNHAVVGVGAHYLHATLDKAKAEALATWADEAGTHRRRAAGRVVSQDE